MCVNAALTIQLVTQRPPTHSPYTRPRKVQFKNPDLKLEIVGALLPQFELSTDQKQPITILILYINSHKVPNLHSDVVLAHNWPEADSGSSLVYRDSCKNKHIKRVGEHQNRRTTTQYIAYALNKTTQLLPSPQIRDSFLTVLQPHGLRKNRDCG